MHRPIEVCPLATPCSNPGEECHKVPFNTNPLELAENICIGAIQHKIKDTDAPSTRLTYRNRVAWAQVELGLHMGNTEEAATAFTQAESRYNDILALTTSNTIQWFQRTLTQRYIPVFAAASSHRRETNAEVHAMAYDVARQTLGEVLVALDTATIKGRPALFGALGEIATLTLALRAGHMLYPTSVREGMTEQEVSKNHDFYGVKDGQKVTPLEVKSSPRHQKHTYDDQITVLYYSDVCREIAQNWPVHERPQLRVLALELARILVQEPNRQLSRYERQFLKLAIAHIDQKLSSAQTDRIQVENNE